MKDGRDIEFVLGGPRTENRAPAELWVLDFNQVQSITPDDDGVALAVEAMRLNDPYYGKPLRDSATEQGVWEAFALAYLHASHYVVSWKLKHEDQWENEEIRMKILALPRKFIRGVVGLEEFKMTRT